jgi:hypothetical protein
MERISCIIIFIHIDDERKMFAGVLDVSSK